MTLARAAHGWKRAIVAARLENMKQGRPEKDASWHFSSASRADAAVMFNISARRIARASEVLDKADSCSGQGGRAGSGTVSCATEIIKLNLDGEDTKELMLLPKAHIPRNVERLKKEAKRKEAFEYMTPEELEAFADPDTSDGDNQAVIAAVAKWSCVT